MEEKISDDVWRRKDKLNARMSAIKAASINCEGTKSNDLLQYADKYYDWVSQDQEWNKTVEGNETVVLKTIYPVPTKEQLKWLDLIKDGYNFTKEQVFDKVKKYPNNKDEATNVVKLLKGNN